MKRVIYVLCLCLMFTFGCQKDSEKYIAIVNDSKIDRAKFDGIIDKQIKQIEKMGQKITPEQKYEFQKNLLDKMVTIELLMQEAKKSGVVISDEDVNKKFALIKEKYPKKEDFEKILKENEITETEVRDDLKKSMTIESFFKKEIFDKTVVDDADVKKFYDENKSRFDIPEQVKASHILIKTKAKPGSPEADKEEKELKEKLSTIRKDILEKKKDFPSAAKEFSECPSKEKGGDLGFFSKGKMIPEFTREAFSQQPGTISQPFKTQFGYHILMVTDKQAAHQKSFDESKGDIKQFLIRQKGGAKAQEHVENLKKNAKITKFLQEPPAPATPAPAPAPTTVPSEPKKDAKQIPPATK